MPTIAHKLRHRVTIQRREDSYNDLNEPITTWVEESTVWASVEPLSVREFLSAQATQSEVSARITIRHREGITAAMRILHRGRVYNVQGVLADPKSGLEYLTLPCSEGANDG